MSMYVRVKREKLTVFLHVDPTDTTELVKSRLEDLLQKPAKDQHLYKDGVLLEDGKTLAELKVENDDELAVVFRLEGEQFEEVAVERFDGGRRKEESS